MKNSDERIEFIRTYLTSYENKIKLSNSVGLFDPAKLFELFAQEICELWFDKKFRNLNENTYTYPCVDLISDDDSIFVQVGTTENISAKIKNTLENILKSENAEINSITNVKFFMLDNVSVARVKDKTIGRLAFTKQTDLITTAMVLQKATTNLSFQTALYELLQRDLVLKNDFDKLGEAITKSKFDISTISHLINNDYEIDRSEFINKIRTENCKNIVILGAAGYGKSAICRKLVDGVGNILFARAEDIVQKNNLYDIWSLDIKKLLEVSDKEFVFFIDSLEFIADNRNKNNLLPYLFETVKDMTNVKIITSCRTTDFKAFIGLTSQYQINSYEIEEVTDLDLAKIAKKYPVIEKLRVSHGYAQLLKSPLYIDLIVSKISDISNISDENEFREYVWQKIICRDDNESKEIVKQIAFTRAKSFFLYVNADEFDNKKINSLVSNGILIKKDSLVRLKYDMFEDICFERYFDDELNNCRGNYNVFFTTVSAMGRCVYRRYQIWVENKILNKENRDNIIGKIVFSNTTPSEWKKETMIGLIKSRFSCEFFTDNADEIIKQGLLQEFVRLINLYGFEIDTSWLAKFSPIIKLNPSGQGRPSLISIIHSKIIYKATAKIESNVLKLLSDYARTSPNNRDETISKYAADILIYYLDEEIKAKNDKVAQKKVDTYGQEKYSISLLKQLYNFSEYAVSWIANYWKQLEQWYKCDEEHYAKEIIKDAISFENCGLAKAMPDELCNLAEMFWTYTRPKDKRRFDFYGERNDYDIGWKYGLSENVESYSNNHYRDSVLVSNFFHTLFYCNFWKGLKWAISFINKAVSTYKGKCFKDYFEYGIYFIDEKKSKTYIGDDSMWWATTYENYIPTVLSDLLYIIQEITIRFIDGLEDKKKTIFAENVKKYIFENSNNIALLSIISNVGLRFQNELPGYSLGLVTNLSLLNCDLQRKVLNMPNPLKDFLEQQMLTSVGLPEITRRYKIDEKISDDLQEYVRNIQIYSKNDTLKKKCHDILDYLYSVTPNTKENGTNYLQIQKMDLRKAKIAKVDENTVAIIPQISGAVEQVVISNEEDTKMQVAVTRAITEMQKKYSQSIPPSEECVKIVDLIIRERNNFMVNTMFDRHLFVYICFALQDEKLSKKIRENYCKIMIEGVMGYLTNRKKYLFDLDFCLPLFIQIEAKISSKIKKEIKLILLESLLMNGHHGLTSKISSFAKKYIQARPAFTKALFNTIIKLSEDEMNHQRFNAAYIEKNKKEKDFVFNPNLSPKLRGVDYWIKQAKAEGKKIDEYVSKKDAIIDDYLFCEKDLIITSFNPYNYDIKLLCLALSCCQNLDDKKVYEITDKAIKTMIDIWKINEKSHDAHEILDVWTLNEVESFLQNQLTKDEESSNKVLGLLFTNIDFSKFTKDTIDFYNNVFFVLTLSYFDAHSNFDRRSKIVNILKILEEKILALLETDAKNSLKKSLMFFFPEFRTHDWSKCGAGYSLTDKEFINAQFIKYGSFNIKEMLIAIRQFHVDKLLPEILISLEYALTEARNKVGDKFREILFNNKPALLLYITRAYIDFGDKIKQDDALTKAFEGLLSIMCDYSIEDAAVILDEFRIH